MGETSYDPTIIANLAIHQDRITLRTRERDQTHSYWYIYTLSPEGELLPPRHGERRDDEDGHR